MISKEYSFVKFLEDIKDKDLPEIQLLASTEAGVAERLSSSITRGIDKATKIRIGYYKKRVGEFAFFMMHFIKPGSVDDFDFELYEPICEILVKKGQLKSDVLDLFKGSDQS
jgi:hypothetical protein